MTDAIIGVFSSLVNWLLSLLPVIPVPTWLAADGPIGTVFTYAGSMGAWFPTTLALTVFGAILAAYAVGFTIKVIRIVASFATLGGGSAA